jgi:hypothetical protein
VQPQVFEELRAKQARQGSWAAAFQLAAQAQPSARTEPAAVPSHTDQVRALAQAFHVPPRVVEELWAKHAKQGWEAVAMELMAQVEPSTQTDVITSSIGM